MILTMIGNFIFWCLLYALNEWECKGMTSEERWKAYRKFE